MKVPKILFFFFIYKTMSKTNDFFLISNEYEFDWTLQDSVIHFSFVF